MLRIHFGVLFWVRLVLDETCVRAAAVMFEAAKLCGTNAFAFESCVGGSVRTKRFHHDLYGFIAVEVAENRKAHRARCKRSLSQCYCLGDFVVLGSYI